MKRLARTTLLALLLAPLPALAGLRVVATLPDFATLASELGGERVEAEALIAGTQDPHFVDARPTMIVKVNRADLLISIGLSLEAGWLPVLLKQARNSKVQPGAAGHLDGSRFIQPREVPATADRAMGDVHAGGNPHYFTSPDQLFLVARAIRDQLIALDPQGKAEYDKRWQSFAKKFEARSAEWKQRLAPLQGQRVVVYHKSWIYLLEWAGLQRAGALEPKPGVSPSPAQVSRLLTATRELGVKLVIQEVYHPRRLSKVFAKKAGARLVILPSMVGAQPGTDTIWGKFDRIVELLTDGT